MAKIGRPRKTASPEAAKRIQELAATGHAVTGIAKALGTSFEVLSRWMREDPALREAYDRGREKERYVLHNTLFKAATEGKNIVAAMFLLKARHGYKEGEPVEVANHVHLSFTLPQPMKLAEFQEVVTDGARAADQLPAATPALPSRRA